MSGHVQVASVITSGHWSVHVKQIRNGGRWRKEDVTNVRGTPIIISSLSVTDPFGPSVATLKVPAVSPLEPIGDGSVDLWWLRENTLVDISWDVTDEHLHRSLKELGLPTRYVWEGTLVSFPTKSDSPVSLTVECQGAMRVLEYRVAKPGTLYRPIPFEVALQRAFRSCDKLHPTGLAPLMVKMPKHAVKFSIPMKKYKTKKGKWKTRPKDPWYLVPKGVSKGERWSKMLTRESGNWGKVLSEYVQPMLAGMYTNRGRYTISLLPGRRPLFHHRDNKFDTSDSRLLVVDAVTPGVSFALTEDHSQTLTTVYGETRSTFSGVAYNGAVVDASGTKVKYRPFANTPWVDSENSQQRIGVARQEVHTDFVDGMTTKQAAAAAKQHLKVYSTAGLVGSVTFKKVDPLLRGKGGEMFGFPRQMITEGMTIRLDGFRGQNPGPLLYISEVSQNVDSDTVVAEVDSKFRDFKTRREAMLRGRDSLRPYHSMAVLDQYSHNIPDPMLRWSYERGSGFFPKESQKLWKRAVADGEDIPFPWTQLTKAYPPKKYPERYAVVHAGDLGTKKKAVRANRKWNVRNGNNTLDRVGRMFLAQAGDVQLFQFAAFDKHGNVLPVSYHVSIWASPTVHAGDTPKLPPQDGTNGQLKTKSRNYERNNRYYRSGSPYPFFRNAWESVRSDGGQLNLDGQYYLAASGAPLIAGWGNFYEKAGYWPGSNRSPGDDATGLLVDTTGFHFNMAENSTAGFNFDVRKENTMMKHATARVLVFCDDRTDEDVYFLGRAYRKLPGA